ncbi:basic amino acid ABC transporter substrate-binding protein [Methanocella arvoryzae]|nr:basic amino acid ABC transporter substrate-binding protein [Methanocella arvoryzae]
MKKLSAVSIIAIALMTVVLVVSGCTTPTATPAADVTPTPAANVTQNLTMTPGVLSVATEAHYPPFENINTTTGEFYGFDIDLMNEIGKELGLEVKYTDHAFDTIIPAVQAGKFDCAISAFTIRPDRQQSIDFTDWYYESAGQAIVTKPGSSIKNASDLVGKIVGAQAGTVGFDATKAIEGMPEENVKSYATMNEAFMALKKGEVEAVVGDYPVCEPYYRDTPGDYALAGPLSETEYFGIVVNKQNKQLTAAINEALANIKADGRYQTIYDRWFA